jgi:hypothetical protein
MLPKEKLGPKGCKIVRLSARHTVRGAVRRARGRSCSRKSEGEEEQVQAHPQGSCLRPEQYLQTLAFESEGYTSPEAQQLLLVWAQMWAEKRNESPAAAKRLYYAWSCELAHLHAKYLARCIMARARR